MYRYCDVCATYFLQSSAQFLSCKGQTSHNFTSTSDVVKSRYILLAVLIIMNVLQLLCCLGKVHVKQLQVEVQECSVKINQLTKLKQQADDILHLREALKRLLTELSRTRSTLRLLIN